MKKINFDKILIFGGLSSEKAVSIASSQSISLSFPTMKCIYWDSDNNIYMLDGLDLRLHRNSFKFIFKPIAKNWYANIKDAILQESTLCNVFIFGLHGGYGENGVLQRLLDLYNRKYVNSNSLSSHKSMNKIVSKVEAGKLGLGVASSCCLFDSSDIVTLSILSFFFYKYCDGLLKPIAEGSSIGCHLVSGVSIKYSTISVLRKCRKIFFIIINKLRKERKYSFIEEFINGREFTVGVYEYGNKLKALTPIEICKKKTGIADYQDKYFGVNISEEILNDNVNLVKSLKFMAKKVHQILGCQGYSRSDFILSRNGKLIYLETNTLPGVSKVSLFPKALNCENLDLNFLLTYYVDRIGYL